MIITAREDPNQKDTSNREKLAVCPRCGQKLFEVESIFRKGLFRQKCRRCKTYIKVSVSDGED